jgi:hypothetical protein
MVLVCNGVQWYAMVCNDEYPIGWCACQFGMHNIRMASMHANLACKITLLVGVHANLACTAAQVLVCMPILHAQHPYGFFA